MSYDVYGNVKSIIDARGYTTDNTYESTYHLFLTRIENAVGHRREFTYDARIAQILTSKDQNYFTTRTEYDVLGESGKGDPAAGFID